MVVIAGQVGTGFLGTDAFQEVDLVGITQPITKWSYQIRSAEDVPWAVARAFYIAKSGRPGPVVLDFAKNAQVEKNEYAPAKLDYIRSYQPVPEMDEEAVRQAAELINVGDSCILIVAAGDARVDNKKYKERFGVKAKMLAHDDVPEYIGHAVGGVCPFAVKEGVKVYLDESLKRFETVFPAAGSANSAIELTIPELEQYSKFDGWVDVCKDWRTDAEG